MAWLHLPSVLWLYIQLLLMRCTEYSVLIMCMCNTGQSILSVLYVQLSMGGGLYGACVYNSHVYMYIQHDCVGQCAEQLRSSFVLLSLQLYKTNSACLAGVLHRTYEDTRIGLNAFVWSIVVDLCIDGTVLWVSAMFRDPWLYLPQGALARHHV